MNVVWILALVPIMALVALADSIIGCSIFIARRIGCHDAMFVHAGIIIFIFVVCFILFIMSNEMPFVITDYFFINKTQLRIQILFEKLISVWMIIDPSILILSIVAVFFRQIRGRHNFILSALSAIFGNVGTIVWMMRN
jgi:hypothetical protein